MQDPYRVLGVNPGVTDEQLKSAYRELVKKYHPDRYANSPLQHQAQEKLKEINLAYDTIVKQRENGGGDPYGGASPQWDFHQGGGGSQRFADIREMIARGLIPQAEAALDRMRERDAEWHFLRGMVCLRRGWYSQAQQNFDAAAHMEPDNPEYQSAAQRMQGAFHQTWQRRGAARGFSSMPSCNNICAILTCLSLCCGGGSTRNCLPFLFCC